MSTKQRELFIEIKKAGIEVTPDVTDRVAQEALMAGNATEAEARALVEASVKNQQRHGIRSPTHLPYSGKRGD